VLGAADADLLFDTTDALAAGDARAALEAVERLSRSGRDPGQFARDLIAHLRQLLVARATGEVPESFTVTIAQPERLAEQAKSIDDAKLVGAIDSLSGAVAAMREGDDPRLTLEVALLKVATPSLDSSREALLRRIESLESRLTGGAPGEPSSAGRAGAETDARAQAEDEPAIELPEPAEAASPATPPVDDAPETPEPEAAVATATVEIERVVEAWPAVVDHLRDSGSAMLSTLFDEARPLAIDEERSMLRIGFPSSAKFNKKKAEAKGNVERMTEAISVIVGQPMRPAYELIEEDTEDAGPERPSELSDEEKIDLIKDNFDATEVVPDEERESEAG
jgi:DNA polymerase III gamma/tau subunit